MGFHLPELIIILLVGIAILGPKALQSMGRSAGKGVGQAKAMKDQVLSELPMEEISKVSRHISRVPMSPQQAVQMLLTPEPADPIEKKQETKKE